MQAATLRRSWVANLFETPDCISEPFDQSLAVIEYFSSSVSICQYVLHFIL